MTVVSHGRIGKTQSIPFNATPATSAPIAAQTNRVRLLATSAALVSVGTAVNVYIPANFPEVFVLTGGQSITVTQFAAAGNLYLSELE